MANFNDRPPADLVERAIVALNLPINAAWTTVLEAAAQVVKCGSVKRYPHNNSRLLLEAMQEAKS